MDVKMNRRAQIAVWVILAIVLVAVIILFFTLGGERDITEIWEPGQVDSVNAPSFMQACTEEYVLEAVDIMLPQGGFVINRNSVMFNKTSVEFMCKTLTYYEPCINQHPMLIREMEEEIRDYVFPKIDGCFDELRTELEKRDGVVDFGNLEIGVELSEDRIFVKLDRHVEIEKKDTKREYESFDIAVESPAYNLARIAIEIASQEAKNCYFEPAGYSVAYPRYDVSRYVMSEPVNIYTIYDKETGQYMLTAIRSCAIPAGL